MASSYMVIFAVALLVEFNTHCSMAFPKLKMEDEDIDQDRAASMADDITGHLSFRRFPFIEGRLADKDGAKRIIVLADRGIKGSPEIEANIGFPKAFPALRGIDQILDEFNMRDQRRNTDDVMSAGKREIDMLRCMIGRVYRPCWQV